MLSYTSEYVYVCFGNFWIIELVMESQVTRTLQLSFTCMFYALTLSKFSFISYQSNLIGFEVLIHLIQVFQLLSLRWVNIHFKGCALAIWSPLQLTSKHWQTVNYYSTIHY